MSSIEKLITRFSICPAILMGIFSLSSLAHATRVNGRITWGGYAASETFADQASGSTRNDFLTTSGRFFLQASEMGEEQDWQTTVDLRDKHDFFDKLEREKLKLTDRNTLQVRQVSARYDKSKNATLQFGRFPLIDAGNVHCDGAAIGYKPNRNWTFTGFGGLNAKRPDQQYVTFNEDSLGYGGFAQFQSQVGGWDNNLFGSLALVEQRVAGAVDRRYLYTVSSQQWAADSRLIHFMYLDFVPRTYIQTAYVDWNQRLSEGWSIETRGLAVDVIEYSRRQGVRERLEASPYKEGNLAITRQINSAMNLIADTTYGKRSADGLDKREYRIKLQMPRLISPKWDSSISGIYRDNFTSKDTVLRGGIGYFSRTWELSSELETGIEKYEDGKDLHPITLEISYGYYLSRELYLALSAEHAKDELVSITSAFIKVGYRFGNEELAPLRNGAAPRGRL